MKNIAKAMNVFKFPDVTPPDRVHTLEDARDALDRANRQLLDAAVRHAALEQAAAELAQTMGRVLAVVEKGSPTETHAYLTALRQRYLTEQRTH